MTTNLFVYPFDRWPEYRDAFRDAKQTDPRLASVKLLPVRAHSGCGRVLALGKVPPFASEFVVVRKKPGDLPGEVVAHLLRWYIGLDDEPRASSVADWLSLALGRKVVEVD